jgi:hypothetical protein
VMTARVVGPVDAIGQPWGARAAGCGPTRQLGGRLDVQPVRSPLEPQALWFADQSAARRTSSDAGAGPTVTHWSRTPTRVSADVAASSTPFDLVLADAYDSRWHAVVDGVDLGAPYQADGYAMGWQIPAGGPRTVELSYRPQRLLVAGFGVSGLALLVCVGVLAFAAARRLARRRRRGVAAAAPGEPE